MWTLWPRRFVHVFPPVFIECKIKWTLWRWLAIARSIFSEDLKHIWKHTCCRHPRALASVHMRQRKQLPWPSKEWMVRPSEPMTSDHGYHGSHRDAPRFWHQARKVPESHNQKGWGAVPCQSGPCQSDGKTWMNPWSATAGSWLKIQQQVQSWRRLCAKRAGPRLGSCPQASVSHGSWESLSGSDGRCNHTSYCWSETRSWSHDHRSRQRQTMNREISNLETRKTYRKIRF